MLIWGFPFTNMTRPLFFAKETIIFPAEQKSPMEHAPLDVLLGEFISLFVPAWLWSDSVEIMAPSSPRKVVQWSKATLPTPACFRFGEKNIIRQFQRMFEAIVRFFRKHFKYILARLEMSERRSDSWICRRFCMASIQQWSKPWVGCFILGINTIPSDMEDYDKWLWSCFDGGFLRIVPWVNHI